MGRHFSNVGGHGHIDPLKQKSGGRGPPVPTPMGSSAGIVFNHGPIFGFFAPQRRHIAPIKVKFGREEHALQATASMLLIPVEDALYAISAICFCGQE